MTFRSTCSSAARRLAACIIFAVTLAPAQGFSSDSQHTPSPSDPPGFIPTPSNPQPPYAPGLLSTDNTHILLPAIPMPADRADDSYRIYAQLLPVGELRNQGMPRDLYLLSDTTISLVPPEQGCMPAEINGSADAMNPHFAVHPAADRLQDFNELLEDFDRRCHERVLLTVGSFPNTLPVRLLTELEQDEFISTRWDQNAGEYGDQIAARYKGAPGLSSFSQVYFNAHHTLAMVYATDWCGGLCVQSFWEVFDFKDGAWTRLAWKNDTIMS
jgi:hypothetical protein